jgi:folate-binding protein YgfZ
MGASFDPGSESGSTVLKLDGRDALALLHRISTNALLDLPAGGARATLFCDFRGRLLHRAVVHLDRDGAVWLLRDDAPGGPLAAFLERHVFREDVRIDDRSHALRVRRAPVIDAPSTGIPGRVSWDGEAFEVDSAPGAQADEVERIRAGRPAHGHEIDPEFNPFEVGLGNEVHLDKGCYTGQEALQRLTTYRSVRRALVRVEGRGATPSTPREIAGPVGPAGRLTSAARLPDPGDRWIGLAVLRVDALESGRPLSLDDIPLGEPERLDLPRPLGR